MIRNATICLVFFVSLHAGGVEGTFLSKIEVLDVRIATLNVSKLKGDLQSLKKKLKTCDNEIYAVLTNFDLDSPTRQKELSKIEDRKEKLRLERDETKISLEGQITSGAKLIERLGPQEKLRIKAWLQRRQKATSREIKPLIESLEKEKVARIQHRDYDVKCLILKISRIENKRLAKWNEQPQKARYIDNYSGNESDSDDHIWMEEDDGGCETFPHNRVSKISTYKRLKKEKNELQSKLPPGDHHLTGSLEEIKRLEREVQDAKTRMDQAETEAKRVRFGSNAD